MFDFIKGKNILLFCPGGSNGIRGKEFEKYLLQCGAKVKVYNERPSGSTLSKITLRILKKKLPQLFNSYIKRITKTNPQKFDYVLVIRGEAFTISTIEILRKAYPQAKLILYLWDILATNNLSNIIPFFDQAYSFDPYDCSNHPQLKLRPLYSLDIYKDNPSNKYNQLFDISFVGTIHSSRAKILKKIELYCSKNGLSFYFYKYLPSRIIWLKDKIRKYPFLKYSEIHFKGASNEEIRDIALKSKAVLDINYDGQHSLSMRPFEAMMLKRKYITTNPEIRNYDFYNPNNILVIDPDNINIPRDFLNSKFESIDSKIMDKYTSKYLVECLMGDHAEVNYWK